MKRKHDVRSRWHTSVRLVQMQLEVSQMILSSTAKELRDSQLVDNRWRNVWIDAQGKRLGVTASGKKERKAGRQKNERTNEQTNHRHRTCHAERRQLGSTLSLPVSAGRSSFYFCSEAFEFL